MVAVGWEVRVWGWKMGGLLRGRNHWDLAPRGRSRGRSRILLQCERVVTWSVYENFVVKNVVQEDGNLSEV